MRRALLLLTTMVLAVAGCGGSDPGTDAAGEPAAGASAASDTSGEDGSVGAAGGGVVDVQPPGQAVASVDGLDFSFEEPGGVECSVADDAITFSFRIGDNEVTLGGGANYYEEGGWLGGIELVVWNPDEGNGPVAYFPELADNGDRIAIDGSSMSYAGPMQKQPPNDGTNPQPVDAGEGTISVTCP